MVSGGVVTVGTAVAVAVPGHILDIPVPSNAHPQSHNERHHRRSFALWTCIPHPAVGEDVTRRRSTKAMCTQQCNRAATESFAEEEI